MVDLGTGFSCMQERVLRAVFGSPSNCSTVCGALPPLVTLGTAPWLAAAACAPAEKASSPAEGLAGGSGHLSALHCLCSSIATAAAAVQGPWLC